MQRVTLNAYTDVANGGGGGGGGGVEVYIEAWNFIYFHIVKPV